MFKQIINIASLAAAIPSQPVTITFQQNISKLQPEHIIKITSVHYEKIKSMVNPDKYDIINRSTSKQYRLNTTTPLLTIDLNPGDIIMVSAHIFKRYPYINPNYVPKPHEIIGDPVLLKCKKFRATEDMHNHAFTLDEFTLSCDSKN